ncbi:MAG: nucleotidyltransferase domain-containing protein [Chloroflexi bacterium]|nr:nucleotidyltransferase domain-containing protein [Chloroflexota bacterium]
MDAKVNFIKTVVLDILDKEKVAADRIILFGSRATGQNTEHSDYDLLVVTRRTMPVQTRIGLSTKIRKELARSLIDADVFIRSGEEVEEHKDEVGTLAREALKEGLVI